MKQIENIEIPTSNTEKASDMELVIELVKHIENPCTDNHGNNLRGVYIREGKRLLEKNEIINEYAKELLENVIEKYPEY